MLHVLNILAARDDDTSQLVWVIAVLLLSAIGTIVGKLRERAKKNQPTTTRSEDSGAPTERRERPSAPAPSRPRETGSRPMPRVPRPPTRSGDRPIGIPRPKETVLTPERPQPVPPRRPSPPPRPVPPAPLRRVAPRPARTLEPEIVVLASHEEPLAALPSEKPAPSVAAPRRPARRVRLDVSPGRLREMIVLREVLGPPVSMRDESSWF